MSEVVIITGGARGQGAAEARKQASLGYRVLVTDILEEKGKELVSELGSSARFMAHDVSIDAQWCEVMSAAEVMGRVAGLVNNAGVFRVETLSQTSVEVFNLHADVNQLGTFLGMKHAARVMEKTGGGSIVNVSSIAGLRASQSISYGASKWATRGMTKTAALELDPRQIRVNSIHPGLIDTDMVSEMKNSGKWGEVERRIPLGRAGTSDEISDLVAFLISDASTYITGAEIVIDGGLTCSI